MRPSTAERLEQDFDKWLSITVKGGKYAYAVETGSGNEQVFLISSKTTYSAFAVVRVR